MPGAGARRYGKRMRELGPDPLLRRCDPANLPFSGTDELPADGPTLGQQRAREAIALAARIGSHGHNAYVMGQPGSGRHAVARSVAAEEAAQRPPAGDWCYLNDFDDPRRPRALRLPAGRGGALRHDLRQLVAELRAAVPAALEAEDYRARRARVDAEFEERSRSALTRLQAEAEQRDVALVQTPDGFAIAPLRSGAPLSQEDFGQLPAEEQQRRRAAIDEFGERLRQHLASVPDWNRERRRRVRELERETIRAAIGSTIAELKARWSNLPAIVAHLARVEADLVEHAPQLLRREPPPILLPGIDQADPDLRFERYDVNVVVDNAGLPGAPTVYEGNPTYQNLVGRIENSAQFGALVTNFTMIRPGALHRANGGFLVLDAERLLTQPFAWEALKRALFERCLRIESPGQLLSLVTTVSLEPEPIPLDVRVILVGTRRVHQLLGELDPDFAELFRVVADFDDHVERTPENELAFARMIANLARQERLRPLDAPAVARLIEHGSRLAAHAGRISTHARSLEDVAREADHLAGAASCTRIGAAHVDAAIAAQALRLGRVPAELNEAVQRASLLIDRSGTAIGQVNGLFVYAVGTMQFGQPVRITATARLGDGEVVDIEREVELGGPIHSKGMMILAGLLGARYALREPLSLHARLVFEQSYSIVEGDSASLAEACALLSALAGAPARQDLAVTGSVNQHGVVQPVGGINEKIEGFFDVCRAGGLTGTQGVILPEGNVPHLMLRADVVEAVAAGRFHVYTVNRVGEAAALLTGLGSGERDAAGNFAPDSLDARVEARLQDFARRRRSFSAGARPAPRYRRPAPG